MCVNSGDYLRKNALKNRHTNESNPIFIVQRTTALTKLLAETSFNLSKVQLRIFCAITLTIIELQNMLAVLPVGNIEAKHAYDVLILGFEIT